MPKRDAIVVEGVVAEALPNAMFRVTLDGGRMVLAHLSGKVRLNFVRVVPGDRVQVELSPYDLSKGPHYLARSPLAATGKTLAELAETLIGQPGRRLRCRQCCRREEYAGNGWEHRDWRCGDAETHCARMLC